MASNAPKTIAPKRRPKAAPPNLFTQLRIEAVTNLSNRPITIPMATIAKIKIKKKLRTIDRRLKDAIYYVDQQGTIKATC